MGRTNVPMLWIQIKNKTKSFQVQGKVKRTKTNTYAKEVKVLYHLSGTSWKEA